MRTASLILILTPIGTLCTASVDSSDIGLIDELDGILGSSDWDEFNDWIATLPSGTAPQAESTASALPDIDPIVASVSDGTKRSHKRVVRKGTKRTRPHLDADLSGKPNAVSELVDQVESVKKTAISTIGESPDAVSGRLWDAIGALDSASETGVEVADHSSDAVATSSSAVGSSILSQATSKTWNHPLLSGKQLNIDERVQALQLLSTNPEMSPSAFFAAMEGHGVSKPRALQFRDEAIKRTYIPAEFHDIIMAASPKTTDIGVQNALIEAFPDSRLPSIGRIEAWRMYCTAPLRAFVSGEAPCRSEANGKHREVYRLSVSQKEKLFLDELMELREARETTSGLLAPQLKSLRRSRRTIASRS